MITAAIYDTKSYDRLYFDRAPDAEQFLTALLGSSMARVVPASLYPPSSTAELERYLDQTATVLRTTGRCTMTSRTTGARWTCLVTTTRSFAR